MILFWRNLTDAFKEEAGRRPRLWKYSLIRQGLEKEKEIAETGRFLTDEGLYWSKHFVRGNVSCYPCVQGMVFIYSWATGKVAGVLILRSCTLIILLENNSKKICALIG